MHVELSDLKTVATLGMGGFGRVELVKGYDKTYALKVSFLPFYPGFGGHSKTAKQLYLKKEKSNVSPFRQ